MWEFGCGEHCIFQRLNEVNCNVRVLGGGKHMCGLHSSTDTVSSHAIVRVSRSSISDPSKVGNGGITIKRQACPELGIQVKELGA